MTHQSSPKASNYIYSKAKHIAITMISFIIFAIILDAKGLVIWADRLENPLLKSIAQPAVHWLDKVVEPIGLSAIREPILTMLQTDDLIQKLNNDEPANYQNTLIASPVTVKVERLPSAATGDSTQKNASTVTATDLQSNATISVTQQTPLSEQLKTLNTKQTIQIVLAGDSMMAVGLSSALQQQYANDLKIHFTHAFKAGTGLSRPDVFDWMIQYPKLTANTQADLVIVAIGANDAQDVVFEGKKYHYGTPEWDALYQQRVEYYIQMITQSPNTQVIWIGLPAMRLPKFNEKIQHMNQLIYTVTKRYPQVSWWNPNPLITKPDGSYSEIGKSATGQMVRLRGQDGIHLSDNGAQILATALFSWYQP